MALVLGGCTVTEENAIGGFALDFLRNVLAALLL